MRRLKATPCVFVVKFASTGTRVFLPTHPCLVAVLCVLCIAPLQFFVFFTQLKRTMTEQERRDEVGVRGRGKGVPYEANAM